MPDTETMPDAQAEAVAAEEPVDELSALQEELEEAKAQAAEYLDGWQRARADFSNYRRRQEQERKDLHTTANSTLISRLLPVLDDLERAFQTLPFELLSLTWIDGVGLIHRKMEATLQAMGLAPIEVKPGQAFDPLEHTAITREEHEDYEEGQVIAEVQRGYKLGERLLRPTMVRVSSGPAEKPEPEGSVEAETPAEEAVSGDDTTEPSNRTAADAAGSKRAEASTE
jgi:molecular chaperone GrpE